MIFPPEVLELIANNSLASVSSASTWSKCLPQYYHNCVHKNMGIIAINNTIDAYTLGNNNYHYANGTGLDEYVQNGAIIYKKKWNGYIPKFNALRAPNDSNVLVINTVFSNADAHYLRFITQKFLEDYQAVLITVISDKPFSDILEFVLSNVAKSLSTRNLPVSVVFQTKRNYISKLYFKKFQIFLPKNLLIELHTFGNNAPDAPASSIDLELIFQNTFLYDIENVFSLQINSNSLTKTFNDDDDDDDAKQKQFLHSDQLQSINSLNVVFDSENVKVDLNVVFQNVLNLKHIGNLHMFESSLISKKSGKSDYCKKKPDVSPSWKNVQDKYGYIRCLKSNDNLTRYLGNETMKYNERTELEKLEFNNTKQYASVSGPRKKIILPPCENVELSVGDLRDNLFLDGSLVTHELTLRNNKLATAPNLFLNSSVSKPTQRNNLAHCNIETVDIANCYFPNIKKLSILQLYWTKAFYSANTVVIWENNNFINVKSLKINSPMMEKILDVQLPSLKNIHLQFHSFANLTTTLQKLYQSPYLEKLIIETNKYTIFDTDFNNSDEHRHLSNCSVILSYMKIKEIVILVKSNTDYEFFFNGLDLTKWSKSDTVVNVKIDPELFESDVLKSKMMNATKKVSKNCNLQFSAINNTTPSTNLSSTLSSSPSSTALSHSSWCPFEDEVPSSGNSTKQKQKGELIFSRTSSTNIPAFYKESTIVVEGTSPKHIEAKIPKNNSPTKGNRMFPFDSSKETVFTNIHNTPQLASTNMPVNPSAFSRLFHSGVEASSARKLSVVDIAPAYTWQRPNSETDATVLYNYANDGSTSVPRNCTNMVKSTQGSYSTGNPLLEPSNKKLKSQNSSFESVSSTSPLASHTDRPQNCKMYIKIQFV
ncbi:hypothetical protein ACO0RG_002546 [Hanseniaspora osmophila]